MLQFCIKRDKDGFSKKFYPKYDLFFTKTGRFLMTAQKMQLMRSAHYNLTLERDDVDKKCAGYLGKLRSNLVGTEFNIFDKGENPDSNLLPSQIRNLMGSIIYVF
jgi:tubby-related protein 1